MFCSSLPKALTTRPRPWENGTAQALRKRNHPCIRRSNIRNLVAMNPHQCAAEQSAWGAVKDGCRPLDGDVDSRGVAVEWLDFKTTRNFNWGRTFHPRSLEFCLNLDGRGEIGGGRKVNYAPTASGYYAVGDEPLPASRLANDHHQFATLEFSRAHLRKQFVENEGDLEPQIRRIIFGDKDETVVAPTRPMSLQQRVVVASVADPPGSK